MNVFLTISLGIVAAGAFGFVARLFRQPLFIGYLTAGIFVGLLGFDLEHQQPLLEAMAQMGVTLLLFLVGLEISLKEFWRIGDSVLVLGVGQIAATSILGFLVSLAFGFNSVESLYIAAALTFSSTIIIVKLLSEKRDLDSLYGKLTVGLLLIQDVVAILILVFLSGFKNQSVSELTFFWVILKGALLFFTVYILARFVLPKIFDRIATSSSELLFVSSIGWMLLVASVASLPVVGFSTEIGGLLAGVALANSSGHLQIASRVKPLRDFFITIFFFLLGTKMVVGINLSVVLLAVLLSIFVITIKPFVITSLLGAMGYKKRTSFLVAASSSQLSEFSLIVVALGISLGHVSQNIGGLVTLTAVFTMLVSTYLISYSAVFYKKLEYFLRLFERKKIKENALAINKTFAKHIVILGCDRTGRRLLPTFKRLEEEVVVVDFNPSVVERLIAEGHTAFYGDVSDVETLSSLNLEESKLVISTVGNVEDNLILLEFVAKFERKPLLIFTSAIPLDALALYEKGADYVVVPQVVGGDHLAQLFSYHGLKRDYFKLLRDRHFDRLVKERY